MGAARTKNLISKARELSYHRTAKAARTWRVVWIRSCLVILCAVVSASCGSGSNETQSLIIISLDTLAAAYASAGQFDLAVATAERALDLTRSEQTPELAQRIGLHLERYRQGRPIEALP
jgi:hypothetical protein